ncbi:MAG: polyprenyl synthetase family protein [Desulfovibrionaceae bacterium]|nr:polyprenyl synthetase family protein [Desulfovibrionaceae bacterium]
MASLLLKARMALELPAINRALDTLIQELPAPSRPAAMHTVRAGGKRLRPLLTILCARLFGAKDGSDRGGLHRLACTLEMLHAATLMHDDVIDNADTRRGMPACHKVFDNTTAILAGDALLSTANACVAEYGSTRLCHVFAKATAETTAGEILELNALRNPNLAADEYTAIIRGKTARLIRAACEMGAIYAGADDAQVEAIAVYGESMGMAFQMVDDALDVADAETIGKPTGGDLREGKLTPPLLLYRNSLSPDEQTAFNRKFAGGAFSEEEVSAICSAIRGLGFDKTVRGMADGYLDTARHSLSALPDNSERDILQEILTYVRDRKK